MVALPLMVPEDGLCAIIFYMDVFYNSKKRNIEPVYSNTAFNVLKSILKKYRMTSFGLSMFQGLRENSSILRSPLCLSITSPWGSV